MKIHINKYIKKMKNKKIIQKLKAIKINRKKIMHEKKLKTLIFIFNTLNKLKKER